MSENELVPYGEERYRDTKDIGVLTDADIRRSLLSAAGVTRAELGGLLRKAIDKTVEKLDAMTSKTFQFQGKAGDTIYLTDHATQLKAAEMLLRFADEMPRSGKDVGPKTPSVTINMPDIYVDTKRATVTINPDEGGGA